MVHVVDGHAVKQDQVLFRTAAADIQAGEAFHAALDAGKQLQGLDDVGLAEQGRHVLDLGQGHLQGSEVDGLEPRILARHDAGGVQFGIAQQGKIDGGVALQVEFERSRVIADVGGFQLVPAGGQGQGIETELVGGCAGLAGEDAGADERLARDGVGDVAVEGEASDPGGGGRGFQHNAASAQLPGDGGAVEGLAERFFERERGRRGGLGPGGAKRVLE